MWPRVLLGCPQLYNRNPIHGTSLWGVTQVVSMRTAYQVAIALVLLSLVCPSEYLKANEYVLDDSGQLTEIPLLVPGELTVPTLLVDIDGESCDFYEDDWCQRYGGNSSCIGCPASNAGRDGLPVQVAWL